MRSNRMNNQSPPRKKRRMVRREKPKRGTLPLLLGLSAALVVFIFFMPVTSQTPAHNITGTEIADASVSSGNPNLRISEVMSSNSTAYPDETGAFPDYIELTNMGDTAIDLEGYGLSDRIREGV